MAIPWFLFDTNFIEIGKRIAQGLEYSGFQHGDPLIPGLRFPLSSYSSLSDHGGSVSCDVREGNLREVVSSTPTDSSSSDERDTINRHAGTNKILQYYQVLGDINHIFKNLMYFKFQS